MAANGEVQTTRFPIARPRDRLLLCMVLMGIPCISNAQSPAEDIAAQVRQQGHPCRQPVTATRDIKRSKPDSAVWILKCGKTRYRVRLDPDMAARITRLGSH
jgi:hypothetical protein